jgi:hypothetical protein
MFSTDQTRAIIVSSVVFKNCRLQVLAWGARPSRSPLSASRRRHFRPNFLKFNTGLLSLIALLFLSGCYSHTGYSWPPFDLSQPGWQVWNGQAVWKPRKSVPELAGDVMVAVNTNGDAFVQFSKTLPFATARLDGRRWQVDFPAGNRLYSGRYPLPSHFAWLQLPALAEGLPVSRPWIESGNLDQWRISNRDASETLRGYLSPP